METKKLEAVNIEELTPEQMRAVIRQLRSKLRPKKSALRAAAPSSGDPYEELRRLVREHWKLTQNSVRLSNSVCDKTILKGPRKGEVLPCLLPLDQIEDQRALSEQNSQAAKDLETPIELQLERLQVYRDFLREVLGCGPLASAYLLGFIEIRREGLKPSTVRKYCGYAVVPGPDGKMHADRPRADNQKWVPASFARKHKPHPLKELDTRGANGSEEVLVRMPLGYNAKLKTRLWLMMKAMRQCAGKCTDTAPYGVTNKYLEVWFNAKHAAITLQGLKAGKADSKGMRKAIDLFLLDLYTVWRAIEGLDIYPSYYDARRGGLHGGIPLHEQGARRYTVEAALLFIGNFKSVPLPEKRSWKMTADDAEPSETEASDSTG